MKISINIIYIELFINKPERRARLDKICYTIEAHW